MGHGSKFKAATTIERYFAVEPIARRKFPKQNDFIIIAWPGYTLGLSKYFVVVGLSDDLQTRALTT